MNCPKCNHIVKDTAKFCENCGAKIEIDSATIECPSCHARIPKDSKFCPDCGFKIDVLAETKAIEVESNNCEPQEDPLDYLFPYIDKGRVGFKSLINNNVYIPAKYEDAREFHEGFAAVKTNGKWGYMDKTGKWRLKPTADQVDDVEDGVAITTTGNKYKVNDCKTSFWSTDNWECFESGLYTSHLKVKGGMFKVWNDGESHWNSDDLCDDMVCLPWYNFFDEGTIIHANKNNNVYISVKKNGKQGVVKQNISKNCIGGYKEIIPCLFDGIGIRFTKTDIYFVVDLNDKCGLYDCQGNLILPIKYDGIGTPSEGLISILDNNKLGYVDFDGRIHIPLKYEYDTNQSLHMCVLPNFHQGCVDIYNRNQRTTINKDGQIIKSLFDNSPTFYYGKAIVSLYGKYGMIDESGNTMIPLIYDYISDYNYDGHVPESTYSLHQVTCNGEKLIIDDNGCRTDYEEMRISKVTPYRIWVKKNGLWGLIDNMGKVIHDCIFTTSSWCSEFTSSSLPIFIYHETAYSLDLFGGLTEARL